jgi:ABC-type microcin C transport system permease subunit YejE
MDVVAFLIVGFGISLLFFLSFTFFGCLTCGNLEDIENGGVMKLFWQFIKETGWHNILFLVIGFLFALMFNPTFIN